MLMLARSLAATSNDVSRTPSFDAEWSTWLPPSLLTPAVPALRSELLINHRRSSSTLGFLLSRGRGARNVFVLRLSHLQRLFSILESIVRAVTCEFDREKYAKPIDMPTDCLPFAQNHFVVDQALQVRTIWGRYLLGRDRRLP